MIATDGRRLVVQKIEHDPYDAHSEFAIPGALIHRAVSIGSSHVDFDGDPEPRAAEILVNAASISAIDHEFPALSHLSGDEPKFPNWRDVIPKTSTEWGRIHLDAKLLLEVAEALHAGNSQVTLDIPLYDEEAPIIVTCPQNRDGFGLLKMCRGIGSHELSENAALSFARKEEAK